jgi:hypothetical protein
MTDKKSRLGVWLESRGVQRFGEMLPLIVIGAIAVLVILQKNLDSVRPLFELATPKTTDQFWLMVAALVNVAILTVAAYGLKSIRLARAGLLLQAKRDSRNCAVQRCEEFAREIVDLNIPLLDEYARSKATVFAQETGPPQFDPDINEHVVKAQVWLSKLSPEAQNRSVVLLNRLEAWSMYFTHQLADPKVAIGPCGPYFTAMVVRDYAVLLWQRNRDPSSGKFPNIVKLYQAWTAESERDQIGSETGALLQRINELQHREKAAMLVTLDDPLGTVIDS